MLADAVPATLPAGDPHPRAIWVLRFGACACFLGWAWQHFRWSVPYGEVLWHPGYFGWLARGLDVSWESYVAEIVTDRRILTGVRGTGVLYLLIAVAALASSRRSRATWVGLVSGCVLLAWLAFCKYVNAGHATATLVEQGGQVLCPIVLLFAVRRGSTDRWTLFVAVIAFWTTFAGHGVYALGLVPTPGHFYGLVHAILGLGESLTDVLLKIAGTLDIVVCLTMFVPALRRYGLAYAVVWGFLTALARPVAGMSLAAPWWGADQFLHEAILRAPHFAIPLYLFVVLKRTERTAHKDQ